jgi:hypothetical protein
MSPGESNVTPAIRRDHRGAADGQCDRLTRQSRIGSSTRLMALSVFPIRAKRNPSASKSDPNLYEKQLQMEMVPIT